MQTEKKEIEEVSEARNETSEPMTALGASKFGDTLRQPAESMSNEMHSENAYASETKKNEENTLPNTGQHHHPLGKVKDNATNVHASLVSSTTAGLHGNANGTVKSVISQVNGRQLGMNNNQ